MKQYKNLKDGKIYTITKEEIKTKTDFGWKSEGYGSFLTNGDNIYLLSTLDRCPHLWERV